MRGAWLGGGADRDGRSASGPCTTSACWPSACRFRWCTTGQPFWLPCWRQLLRLPWPCMSSAASECTLERRGRQHCSWARGSRLMHYIGMEAMRLAGDVRVQHSHRDAVGRSGRSSSRSSRSGWCFTREKRTRDISGARSVSAVIMGAAIPVMHYTGMAAATVHAVERPSGPVARDEYHRAGNGGNHDRDHDGAGPCRLQLHRGSAIFRTSPAEARQPRPPAWPRASFSPI